jgi:hypothetical protein
MTPEVLISELAKEIKKITKDVILYDEEGKQAALNAFEQMLPRNVSESDTEPFPYCVVKFDESSVTGVGERQPVLIELQFGIYYDKPDCQYHHTMLSIFEKIKARFIDKNFLGPFRCEPEMKFALSPDDDVTYPYYYGGVAMKWMVPGYERKDWFS